MTQPDARLEITPDEYRQRRERLCLLLQAQGLDAVCVFAPVRVAYLSGFFFSATERPIALVVTASGEVAALLPRLEVSHYELQGPGGTLLEVYAEYPGGGTGRHPMRHLQDLLTRLGLQDRRVAADVDGYEHRWGYRGPALSEVLGRPVPSALALIDDLRAVKSSAEIALMREACRWGDHAHRLMQDGLHVGAQELLVSHAASLQATEDLLGTLGGRYVPKSREGMPANAMFIRGANTAHPHGLQQAGPVQRGDVLVTGAYGIIGGYESELERTMIVGDPGPDVARYFGAMLTAQQVAFGALRPAGPARRSRRTSGRSSGTSWAWTASSATTPATRSASKDTSTRSWTSTTTASSCRAWSSPSNPDCTSRTWPGSATPIPWSSRRPETSVSASIRATWRHSPFRSPADRPASRTALPGSAGVSLVLLRPACFAA